MTLTSGNEIPADYLSRSRAACRFERSLAATGAGLLVIALGMERTFRRTLMAADE
jgi:hypothetical protein